MINLDHNNLQLKDALAILALIVVLFFFSLLPVHQMAKSRSLEIRQEAFNGELTALDEEARILLAFIAKSSLPEVVISNALQQGIEYEKIPLSEATYVKIEEMR